MFIMPCHEGSQSRRLPIVGPFVWHATVDAAAGGCRLRFIWHVIPL
jgi:hypothetical protein